ncbi:MAG: amidohydrolase family protein, partial [Planctomycetales bacterium]
PLCPLLHITTAVTRKGYEGKVHGPGEAISVERALRAVTIDAAYTLEKEKEFGSIEVGKRADMIILDQNLLEIEPTEIGTTKVLATIFDGELVYNAPIEIGRASNRPSGL